MDFGWRLDNRVAQLHHGPLQGRLDLERPEAGLHELGWHSAPLAKLRCGQVGTFRGGSTGIGTLVDAYVRDADLVATYEATSQRPIRTQLYWRLIPDLQGAVLEFIASVQTHLLDSDPSTVLTSVVPASDGWRLIDARMSRFETLTCSSDMSANLSATEGAPCVVWRPPSDWSYAEMVHPADFAFSELSGEAKSQTTIRHLLFHRRLEKGVILRSRIRVCLFPRTSDFAAATACYQQFVSSDPPLTT